MQTKDQGAGRVDVLLGLQWGDEGKGKVVDVLAKQYDVIARFQGGPNAGHSLVFGEQKFVLHTIPSGVFRKGVQNIVANGVVIDPISLQQEIETLAACAPHPTNAPIPRCALRIAKRRTKDRLYP